MSIRDQPDDHLAGSSLLLSKNGSNNNEEEKRAPPNSEDESTRVTGSPNFEETIAETSGRETPEANA